MKTSSQSLNSNNATKVETLPSFASLLFASALGALGGVACAMMLFGYAYRAEFSDAIREISQTSPSAQPSTEQVAAEKAPKIDSQDYMNAFVWTARVRLEDLGLGKSLKVSATPDGSIRIEGALLPNQAGRYSVFKGWFQSRESYPPLIDDVNFLKTSGVFPKIQSVWLGNEPIIHLENGNEARIGSVFGDGWTVVQIGRRAMTLERDGMIVELSYESDG